jgi:hypothetical protein
MDNPYNHILIRYQDPSLPVIIVRSFEFIKDYKLDHYSKQRKRYGEFNFTLAKAIFKYYSDLINIDYEFKIYKKLKAINKLYQYIYLFISDILQTMPKVAIAIYRTANDMNRELNIIGKKYIGLKKFTKKNILNVINALNILFESNLAILVRLPYELICFTNVLNKKNIFNAVNECKNIWLESQTAKYMNNIYRMEIILLLSHIKKLNNHIILYILKFLLLKGDNINNVLDNLTIYNKKGIYHDINLTVLNMCITL